MSRASDDYTDHCNRCAGKQSEVQPDKCEAARIEQAAAYLRAHGFTVTQTETE